jgi:membrane protein DedA with SNARE-associated domain
MNAIGALLLTAGLLFTAQGAGWIHWPPESVMLDRREWIYYGLAVAAAGLALLWKSHRR